jgi:hypothetical protein
MESDQEARGDLIDAMLFPLPMSEASLSSLRFIVEDGQTREPGGAARESVPP